MEITLKYTLHSDELPPDPSLDLHKHTLIIEDIRSFMFDIRAQEAAPPPPPPTETFFVVTDWVNVRKQPNTQTGIIIGKKYKGDIVDVEFEIIDGLNRWAGVIFDGKEGYIAIFYSGVEYLRKV